MWTTYLFLSPVCTLQLKFFIRSYFRAYLNWSKYDVFSIARYFRNKYLLWVQCVWGMFDVSVWCLFWKRVDAILIIQAWFLWWLTLTHQPKLSERDRKRVTCTRQCAASADSIFIIQTKQIFKKNQSLR